MVKINAKILTNVFTPDNNIPSSKLLLNGLAQGRGGRE
jgi:hypothetical protein